MTGHMLVVRGHHEMTQPLGGPTYISQPQSGTQTMSRLKNAQGGASW